MYKAAIKLGIINLKRKIPSRNQRKKDNSIAKNFVDRETQRNIFKDHITKISDEYSLLLFYSGAGGSGKTALIRELENSLFTKESIYKYASYDFKEEGADMITTLNALKKILMTKYDAEFPLYEKGYIYYLQKRGDMVSREHIEDVFNRSSVLQKTLGHMGSTIRTLDNANMMTRGAKVLLGGSLGVLSFLDKAYDTSLLLKILRMGITELDKIITERVQKAKEKEDLIYAEIIQELEGRNCNPQADVIKEYLPVLFARDISDWLRENNSKLIIFLDTYESLTGDEKYTARHEKLVSINYDVPVDWWVEELLTRTNRILWVIAGRSEISKIGEEIEIIRDDTLFTLTALENKFADKFLSDSGIENPKLRQEIINLTDGYPNFLSVCVDTYKEIIAAGGKPAIDDFGEKREVIVNRLINFMDEGARNMLKRLCILGTWTDDIAQGIFSILHENNSDTYKRIKKLSFIFAQSVGSMSKKIIRFDSSIQKILFDYLKETDDYFINETRKAVNKFFRTVFCTSEEKNFLLVDVDLMQFFKIWCEIISRTSTDAEDLVIQYENNLRPLHDIFDDNFIEGVIKELQNKVRVSAGVKSNFFAYFEHLLAKIKLRQSKDKDAIKYAESAYSKFENSFNTDKHAILKISVIDALADVYKKLKRTANEIALRKKILAESKKIFKDKTDDHIITAQKNLADALERGDKKNRARILRKEILITLKSFNDERTMQAASDYAAALGRANKHKYAVSIREKIVDFYRNTTNTDKFVSEIKNLILELNNFSSDEYLEKKLTLQKELAKLYSEKDGEYSTSAVYARLDVFNTLRKLNRKKDAIWEQENFAEKFKIHIKETSNQEEKVTLIKDLINILQDIPKADEAAKWRDRLKKNLREIISIKLREPVENYEEAIFFANNLIDELNLQADYHEVIELQRAILRLTENNPHSTFDEIVSMMKYFAYMLAANPTGYEEALEVRNKVVATLKQKFFYDKINKKILGAMDDIALFFEKIVYDPYLALAKRQEILHLLQENTAPFKQILDAMEKIAELYIFHLDNFIEGLNWRKRILKYCQQNFSSDSSEVISAMENLASIYENLDEYSVAAKLRAEIVEIKAEKRGEKSNSDVIDAQKIIADQLHEIGTYEQELEIRKKIISLYRKNYEENSVSRYEIITSLKDVVNILQHLGREKEAYITQKTIIDELKKDYEEIVSEVGEYSTEALMKMDAIAEAFYNVENYDESLAYRKKMLERCQSIDENSVETIYSLEKLAEFFSVTDNEKEEFKIRAQIVNICKNKLDECVYESSDDKEKLFAMYRLLIAEKDFGNEENVVQMEEKILITRYFIAEKRRKIFGNNHPITIAALEDLAEDLHAYDYCVEELKVRRDILSYLKENSAEDFNEEILKEMKAISDVLYHIGNFKGFLKIWQEIFYFCHSQKAGDMSDETLNAMNNIAMAFENLKDYRAVLKIRRDIIDIYRKKYSGENYQDAIIKAMYDEARALENLQDYHSAILILRQIVELYTKRYGESGYIHDNTINAIDYSASLLEHIGDFENAIKARQNIVILLEKKYPAGHEKIINAMKNVAYLFEKKGDYEQALEWRENILNLDKDFINSSYELANTLDFLNLHIKANKVRKGIFSKLEKLLTEYVNIYGQKSEKVIETLKKLSRAARSSYLYEDEINYDKLLVKILIDFKGPTSKKTLDAMITLADACESVSESLALIYRENVAEIQEQILNFRIENLGNNHSLTIDIREKLARTFVQLNYPDNAVELQKENLSAYKMLMNRYIDKFTEFHEITLNAMCKFAAYSEKLGHYDEAEKILSRVCKIYEIKFSDDVGNFKIISSLEKLVSLLEKMKNFDKAVIVRNKINRLLKENMAT